jgi:hypothetical protein
MGVTAQGSEWRCPACHGRLVKLATVEPPPPKGKVVRDGGAVASAIEVLAEFAEMIFGA